MRETKDDLGWILFEYFNRHRPRALRRHGDLGKASKAEGKTLMNAILYPACLSGVGFIARSLGARAEGPPAGQGSGAGAEAAEVSPLLPR